MRCSKCNTELVKLTIKNDDGHRKDVWSHPELLNGTCEYLNDGLKVTIEVLDPYLVEAFQKLVNSPENDLNEPQETLSKKMIEPIKEINLLLNIKERLATGSISIETFDRIFERIQKK